MRPASIRGIKLAVIVLVTLLLLIVTLLQPPFAQPQSYHLFADQRMVMGVPNLLNVLSNLPFAVVGIFGLYLCYRYRMLPYTPLFVVVFIGVFLTAFGSAYYHLAPDNQTLIWDRLPMTIAIMGFFTYLLTDCIGPALRRLLWPLLILGVVSVWYWAWTETMAAGDLRLYGLVQFLPIALMPLVLFLFPCGKSELRCYIGLLLSYGLAKLLEHFDLAVWVALEWVSGHTLKHLAAAVGTYFIILLLRAYAERELARP